MDEVIYALVAAWITQLDSASVSWMTRFTLNWHLPQQLPAQVVSRTASIVVAPISTADSIVAEFTLLQTHTIILMGLSLLMLM
ncbi:hypothetical protein A9Q78_04515 [Methylophaga sp. 41_12_T18]|nr:hypothetical protein A9Q78_04515 [Methylophaga sp. 41_12_T18]